MAISKRKGRRKEEELRQKYPAAWMAGGKMAAEFYASGLGEPDLHESGELVKVNRTIAWQNYQADNPAAAKDELIAVQVNFSKVLWKLLTGTELDDF